MKTRFLSVLWVTATGMALVRGDPVSFQKLKAGEVLVVAYEASGCFHPSRHEITFRRAG